ncbi:MAG: amino acid ABC transporter permease [Cohaesibacteraceae bacterium]|nr:amino acid ABC transporter permease [Cohaesibacteraceae bacterium]MBL4877180.1 amino acid ABC transporter permease [Cohaesibacteraceae bacterium]
MAAQEHMASADGPPKVSLFNDPKIRGLFYQVLLIVTVVWIGYSITMNAATNLAKQGLANGWKFLGESAGFPVTQSLIEYSAASSYQEALVVGFLNTVLVGVFGIFIATIVGFTVGIARLSKNWVVAKMATVYVEILRNIPLLLQIFFWYFAVLRALPSPKNSIEFGAGVFMNNRGLIMPKPIWEDGAGMIGIAAIIGFIFAIGFSIWAKKQQAETGKQYPSFSIGVLAFIGLPILAAAATNFPFTFDMPALKGFNFKGGMKVVPEFVALLFALSIYTASFIAEIVRAGILAVDHGQTEAANALGLQRGPILRLIIIPQAMRVIIPPLTSQYLNLFKNSTLAVAIAYPDLVSVGGTILNQTGQAIEIIGLWMAIYLTVSILTSMFMNWYNSHIAMSER